MANNGDLGFDGPSPDYVPDENTDLAETVGATGDLDPMVFLSKLEKVQENFDRQLMDVRFMLGQMETRAVRAETALDTSERTIENMVGFNSSLVEKIEKSEKAAEKAAKKPVNPGVVGKKKSVTIATGPDTVSSPKPSPSRNDSVDGGRGSALDAARSLNRSTGASASGLTSSPIGNNSLNVSGASLNFCNESSPPTVVPPVKPSARRSSCFIGSRTSEAEEALFDREEIMNLGLDFVTNQSSIVKEVQRVEKVAYRGLGAKSSFSTRKKAIETPPFTGDIEWSRWFNIFTSDCAANGWDETEVFAALRVLNRDGPGAVAIRQHAKSGGTYLELVTALTVVCGATDADLRWRRAEGLRQCYGETSRNFGLLVMNVTREAAAGEGYPEHWVMRKICTFYMNGLRDPGLRERLNRDYDHRCHSIKDLFNIAAQYIQREHRFASGELTATKECYATVAVRTVQSPHSPECGVSRPR